MVKVQLATYENGVVHVQGKGPTVNRAYGVAVNLESAPKFYQALNGQSKTARSLAGSDRRYSTFEAVIQDGKILLSNGVIRATIKANDNARELFKFVEVSEEAKYDVV